MIVRSNRVPLRVVSRRSAPSQAKSLQPLVNPAEPYSPGDSRRCHDRCSSRQSQPPSSSTARSEASACPFLPSWWTKEFKALKFLHLEGKQLFTNLATIDDQLFSNMPQLMYLQFAVHTSLCKFPPLSGVPRLRNVVLAFLLSLEDVPAMDNLLNLRRLELIYLPLAKTLPDLSRLKNLIHFAVFRRVAFCCNGFLGESDPMNLMCVANPNIGIPTIECPAADEPRALSGLRSVVHKFSSNFCIASKYDIVGAVDALDPASVQVCGGVPYRRCEYPAGSGQIGMCYNNRMEVLSCILNDDYIRLRQAQIAADIGSPCDPVEEAWLGCKPQSRL